MEIILASFFTIPLRGIGQGLSATIISSFKIFVGESVKVGSPQKVALSGNFFYGVCLTVAYVDLVL